jgi:von Willebrand factor type A domain
MTNRRLLVASASVVSLGLLWTVAPSAQAIQRSIYASVLTKEGAPVAELGPSDFVVREDNLSREVLRVEPASTPMQVALLVDNSQRSSANIRDLREATNEFVKGITGTPQKNELAVISVAERATIVVDYTTDQEKILKGAGRIFTQPNSGAYMLDAIFETAQGLKKREATRPVIVGIATNGPELSNRYHEQILTALHGIGASFHLVMIGTPPTDFASSEGRERAIAFSRGTEETGGRYDNVLAASALADRLKQVANELTHQYLVTYARPQTLIPPEHVTIAGKNPNLTVRGTPVNEKKDTRGAR